MNTEHKQVRVEAYGRSAEVDEMLAPLIREIWRCDIETINSCQGEPNGVVWLEFESATDAEDFMNIVADFDPKMNSVYQRMQGDNSNAWEFTTHVEDVNLIHDQEGNPDHKGDPDFRFSMSVRFPRSDFQFVLGRLKAHQPMEKE